VLEESRGLIIYIYINSTLTQLQAHKLAEFPQYDIGEKYAYLVQMMMSTLLYGTTIPLVSIYSVVGLSVYYLVDKYNLTTKRTVK
jgi:hypothetical protein